MLLLRTACWKKAAFFFDTVWLCTDVSFSEETRYNGKKTMDGR